MLAAAIAQAESDYGLQVLCSCEKSNGPRILRHYSHAVNNNSSSSSQRARATTQMALKNGPPLLPPELQKLQVQFQESQSIPFFDNEQKTSVIYALKWLKIDTFGILSVMDLRYRNFLVTR